MRTFMKYGLLAAVVGSIVGLADGQASAQNLELTITAPAGAGGRLGFGGALASGSDAS